MKCCEGEEGDDAMMMETGAARIITAIVSTVHKRSVKIVLGQNYVLFVVLHFPMPRCPCTYIHHRDTLEQRRCINTIEILEKVKF